MRAHLSIRGATKTWPLGVIALDDVNLDAAEGTVTAVIGPSGAGKSTLLRIIANLDAPDRGVVENPFGAPGLCFSEPSLWPHLTLLENVRLPLVLVKRMDRVSADRQARSILEEWALSHRLQAYPAELSLGQQQRGALARTAIMDPKVVCLDEVTSSLDPELTATVIESLIRWKERGAVIIVATHQRELLRAAADQILFLESGKTVERGAAAEILNSDNVRTRAFLDATPRKLIESCS
jgi:polar amino acid transport system ATP-binding protein